MISSRKALNSGTQSPLSRIAAILLLLIPAVVVGVLTYAGHDATLALIGAIVLAMATMLFAKPETTTMVVFFVLYANLSVVAIRTYDVPEIMAASFFLLLALPFLNYVFVRRQQIVTNRIFFLMVIYLGVVLVSAAFSTYIESSVSRLVSLVLEGLALYFLVINAVRTREMVRWGIWAIILAGVFMGSVSLYQEFTGDYDNDFGGLAKVKESEVDTGEVDEFGDDIKRRRLAGTIGSKNFYAQMMVVLLPIAMMRIWAERSRLLRILAMLACIPIIGGALLTFSRGAGVAIIITFVAMLLLRIIKLRHFIIIAILGYIVIVATVPEYIYRLSTIADLETIRAGNVAEATSSFRSRSNVTLATFNIFLDHPLLGVGPGQTNQYTTEYGNEVGTYYRSIERTRRAHNMYLEELADTGVIGFVLFISIPLITMYQLWQVRHYWSSRRRPDVAYTAAGFFLALVAYLATAFFLHLSYVRYYWFILAFAAAFIRIYTMQEQTDIEDVPGARIDFLRAKTFQ